MSDTQGSKRELLQAYKEALGAQLDEERNAAAELRRRKQRTPYLIEALLCIAAIAIGVFVLHRDWFIEGPVPPPPPMIAEANTRAAMYVTSMQLRQYQKRTGTYPDALTKLPVPTPPWVTYRLDSAGAFVLQSEVNGRPLTLTAADDPKAFVGSSFSRLKNRGQ